ncbi:putative ferric-chelate reductase 1 [Nerophis ophidion]|uniref:putative ferric-chelate reductase 1 n=1 Tax=Nerophis ophidion TaxID=159077 RepID=UPI002AE0B2FA|nr:putative ferric-chelate reductase 1 [Nerophis ophidion]
MFKKWFLVLMMAWMFMNTTGNDDQPSEDGGDEDNGVDHAMWGDVDKDDHPDENDGSEQPGQDGGHGENVKILEEVITDEGCGRQQLCAAQPPDCNPSEQESCFFISAELIDDERFEFSLSGESDGYVAGTLSSEGRLGENITYICAKNNSRVQFFGVFLVGDKLTQTSLPVDSVRGNVSKGKIQCTFTVYSSDMPSRGARMRRQSTGAPSLLLSVSNGSFDTVSGALGTPTSRLMTSVVNLANPNNTVINILIISNTTGSGHSPSLQHSVTRALLTTAVVLAVLAF